MIYNFSPAIVKKHQKEVTGIEEQILALCAKGGSVRDIQDHLAGFSEAFLTCFPQTEIQRCIVYQIRNSARYVSYKDTKKLLTNLKPVYTAPQQGGGTAGTG